MKSIILIFTILIFTLASCNSQEKPENRKDPRVIDLGNKASALSQGINAITTKEDSLLLLESIAILDSAIALDSSNTHLYLQKVGYQLKLSRRLDALAALEKICRIKKSFPEAITMEGYIYERLGIMDSAMSKYKQAIEIYKSQSRETEEDRVNNEASVAFLLFFVKGRDESIKAFDCIKPSREDDKVYLKMMRDNMFTLDREKWIKNF